MFDSILDFLEERAYTIVVVVTLGFFTILFGLAIYFDREYTKTHRFSLCIYERLYDRYNCNIISIKKLGSDSLELEYFNGNRERISNRGIDIYSE